MSEQLNFRVLRGILETGNTHPDFFAMCDMLEGSHPITPDPNQHWVALQHETLGTEGTQVTQLSGRRAG